jgi:enoyl-CoA hydratase/carnithine racemase
MPNEPVLFEVQAHIGQITLNRPENRNRMTPELLEGFSLAVNAARARSDLRCLVITGTGGNFCAGADLLADSDDGSRRPHEDILERFRPFLAVGDLEIPVIAALNGHAIGGGFGLALLCDLRVANMQGRYGADFARLGLHSGLAVSYVLPRLIGLPMTNELLLTGRLVTGAQAAAMGLVNYAEEPEEVLHRAHNLAQQIAGCAPLAVRMIKASIYRGMDWHPRQVAELDAHLQSRTFEMEDAREGIRARLEKREPHFKGR